MVVVLGTFSGMYLLFVFLFFSDFLFCLLRVIPRIDRAFIVENTGVDKDL